MLYDTDLTNIAHEDKSFISHGGVIDLPDEEWVKELLAAGEIREIPSTVAEVIDAKPKRKKKQ